MRSPQKPKTPRVGSHTIDINPFPERRIDQPLLASSASTPSTNHEKGFDSRLIPRPLPIHRHRSRRRNGHVSLRQPRPSPGSAVQHQQRRFSSSPSVVRVIFRSEAGCRRRGNSGFGGYCHVTYSGSLCQRAASG